MTSLPKRSNVIQAGQVVFAAAVDELESEFLRKLGSSTVWEEAREGLDPHGPTHRPLVRDQLRALINPPNVLVPNARVLPGFVEALASGRCRARTSDLLLVRQALSQLS